MAKVGTATQNILKYHGFYFHRIDMNMLVVALGVVLTTEDIHLFGFPPLPREAGREYEWWNFVGNWPDLALVWGSDPTVLRDKKSQFLPNFWISSWIFWISQPTLWCGAGTAAAVCTAQQKFSTSLIQSHCMPCMAWFRTTSTFSIKGLHSRTAKPILISDVVLTKIFNLFV